jgi:CSLREA domain-containing protein
MPARPPAILLLVCALAAACGRLGFEAREIDGDGGPPDARDGDGGSTPDGGPGPDDCAGTLVVTTAADEDDAGESAEPPHAGAGLSLREAIQIANARAGFDCINFSGVTAVATASELPSLEDPDGTAINGGAGVRLSAGGDVAIALRLVSDGNQLFNLEITGVQVCLQANGAGSILRGLYIHDCSSAGLVVAATATGTEIGPCLLHDSGDTAIQALGTTGLTVRNCTIATNGGSGIDATAAGSDLLVENSIVFDNRDYGVAVDPGATATVVFSDLAANRLEQCLNCTPGEGSIASNPMFVDPIADDYSLMPGSPAIDTGRLNGIDVNGAASGDFNGVAPDMGGIESP